jgi:hypothetical protein
VLAGAGGCSPTTTQAETLDAPDAYAAAGIAMRTAELEATVIAEPNVV